MSRRRPVPFPAPLDTGAYLLLMRVRAECTLDIGRLGRLHFARGNYIYIGSGMGGLHARVARHFRSDKKVKWHIDRLLGVAELSGAVLFPSQHRHECRLAQAVLAFPGARAVPGFGSSDCRCPGHLVFLGARPFGALLGRLDDRVQGAGCRVLGRAADSVVFGTPHPAPRTLSKEALH